MNCECCISPREREKELAKKNGEKKMKPLKILCGLKDCGKEIRDMMNTEYAKIGNYRYYFCNYKCYNVWLKNI